MSLLPTWLHYPKEPIPLEAIFYRHIHFQKVSSQTERPNPAAFEEFDLSCDWDKYSTPESSREILGLQFKHKKNPKDPDVFKNPNDFFLCKLDIKDLFELEPPQAFEHKPVHSIIQRKGFPNNRAHSLILGTKFTQEDEKNVENTSIRGQLALKSQWVIFNKEQLKILKKKR